MPLISSKKDRYKLNFTWSLYIVAKLVACFKLRYKFFVKSSLAVPIRLCYTRVQPKIAVPFSSRHSL